MSLLDYDTNVAQAGNCCLFAALPTQNLFLKGLPKETNAYDPLCYPRRQNCLVKVGISDSFDARLSKLRRENADEIEVLQVFHGDVDAITELERSLHQELSGVNSHHEWFEDARKSARLLQAVTANLTRKSIHLSCTNANTHSNHQLSFSPGAPRSDTRDLACRLYGRISSIGFFLAGALPIRE